MKHFIIALCLFTVLCSCDAGTKPYIQHEIKSKKISDDCSNNTGRFNMVSNTIGERYVFEQCLDADFDPSKMKVDRRGDTVVVSFDSRHPSALYELTVDIDTYPRYHFLTIGTTTFSIIPAAN